ncbi:MAG: hypothetical protein DWQ07_07535 [Chloroflexi bacterium]|nr:MAG: hypothetical protein DWQ07_07535 [Chloroflexota bacterium]MBL1195446.1 hypothetical protein [Chloroflexota bacterium]NOH12729.1 hypothetical protein [Chloroflexota bacterium]
MAKTERESLKRRLLIGFVLVNVVLIVLVWADGLVEHETVDPSFYRETFVFDDSLYITETALAEEYGFEPVPTHEEGEEHEHSGGGGGNQ